MTAQRPHVADLCPDKDRHTPGQPSDYTAWHDWAAIQAATHTQRRCPTCRQWAIWVPKTTSQEVA